jgi:hypothetical protein
MKKYLLIFLILFSFLKAEYLLFLPTLDNSSFVPRCVDDYYFTLDQTDNFLFLNSHNGIWGSRTIDPQFYFNDIIYSGYIYDNVSDRCIPDPLLQYYGLNFYDYNALLALMGLLIGIILFATITYLFVRK